MIDKLHVYMCFQIASIISTAGIKTKFFPSPFLVSTSWVFILTESFRNDYVAVLRSVTEKNEMVDYLTVPPSSEMA